MSIYTDILGVETKLRPRLAPYNNLLSTVFEKHRRINLKTTFFDGLIINLLSEVSYGRYYLFLSYICHLCCQSYVTRSLTSRRCQLQKIKPFIYVDVSQRKKNVNYNMTNDLPGISREVYQL